MPRPNTSADFWNKVDRRGPDECWPWLGARNKQKYGVFSFQGAMKRASRLAFFFTHGYWPNICRHECDNPPCCNPAHLVDGTHQDNVDDRTKRGRYTKVLGSAHCRAVLTEEQVLAIRRDMRFQRVIAKQYGIAQTTVSAIKRRLIWDHI